MRNWSATDSWIGIDLIAERSKLSTPALLIASSVRGSLPKPYDALVPGRGWSPGDPLAPATWIETESADGSSGDDHSDQLRTGGRLAAIWLIC